MATALSSTIWNLEMLNKLIVKYREAANPLLLRELRLVLAQSKMCFWEAALPIFWLLYLTWNLYLVLEGSSTPIISCSRMLCWLTAIFIAGQYWGLAPRLASSVCSDSCCGIYKMLRLTPRGCYRSLILKFLAFSAPYLIEWFLFSFSSVAFCLLLSNLNAEIVLAACVYSLLSLMLAACLGVWWGISFQNVPDKCAASLRKLLLTAAVVAYFLHNFWNFSQIETVLVLSGLLLVLWNGTIRIFFCEFSVALALLLVSLSFVPTIIRSNVPLEDCFNPIRVSLAGMYALDRESLQSANLASDSAYFVLREHLVGNQESPYLSQLLHLYNRASQVSQEQIYAQVRGEAEIYLFKSCAASFIAALVLAVSTCLMLWLRLRLGLKI